MTRHGALIGRAAYVAWWRARHDGDDPFGRDAWEALPERDKVEWQKAAAAAILADACDRG